MSVKLGTRIYKSFAGFRKYLRVQADYIKDFATNYQYSNYIIDDNQLESIIDAVRLKELEDRFYSILTEDEEKAVKYYRLCKVKEPAPDKYEKNLSSAYEKWLMIFFSDQDYLFKPIDPVRIGKIMELVIEEHTISKTHLAERLGIDRNTLTHYIQGKRVPSLDVIYRFSEIFNISIDWIMKIATK